MSAFLHSLLRYLADPALTGQAAAWRIWTCWYVQDLLVLLLTLGLVALGRRQARQPQWRRAFRQLFQRRLVRASFVVLCLYTLVALADSVGYHPFLRDDRGVRRTHPETGAALLDENGLSLLDVVCAPLRNAREKTYSAPLATHQLNQESVTQPDGTLARVNPALVFPRRHLLGTDKVGLDVLYLALKGIRTGLIIGLGTTLLVLPFALCFGILAGYCGGWIDDIIQFIYTAISSIPFVLLIVAFMSLFDQPGLLQLCFIMGIASWTGLCRVLRGETLRLREMEYVQAARATGVPPIRIMATHIAPNVMHLVLITAVISFSGRVLAEAVLTYLGIGVGPDTISWGTMINDALGELSREPVVWWKFGAAVLLMLGLVLPANLFGDALRDALDPRLRTE